MQIRPDPLVDELRRLAPETSVGGGSFAHWLPSPTEVPPADRYGVLKRATQDATGKCLTELLAAAGLPAVEPGHLASGGRKWPAGYIGSVSHEGTKVVAALASTSRVRSLGIDIETLDGAEDLSGIGGLAAADELLPGRETVAPVLLFSVKEAVYKALNPITGRQFGFEDIIVSWVDVCTSDLKGTARGGGVAVDVRCSVALPSWAVSVALVPP